MTQPRDFECFGGERGGDLMNTEQDFFTKKHGTIDTLLPLASKSSYRVVFLVSFLAVLCGPVTECHCTPLSD